MHYYLRLVLFLASACGVFPVQNLHRVNIKTLCFKWSSVLSIYSLVMLTGFLMIEINSLDFTIRNLNENNLKTKGEYGVNNLHDTVNANKRHDSL